MTALALDIRPRTRLRLTRRGRAVFAAIVLVPALSAVLAAGINSGAAAAGDAQSLPGSLSTITITEGQSLWSVAQTIAPDRDPREVIADIVRINRLESANVPAGLTIALPAY